jgi:cyclopropane fatty-acyl-phospholipid synthase-like methyltransferase
MKEREFQDYFYSSNEERIIDSLIIQQVRQNITNFLALNFRALGKSRLLSLGCGTGIFEVMVAPLVKEIVGIDFSTVAIQKAQERAKEKGLQNIDFLVGDALKMEEVGKPFDAVLAIGFFHHLNDLEIMQVLTKCREALNPGGLLIAIDPSKDRFVKKFKWIFSYKYEKYHSPKERELDLHSFLETFSAAGFEQTAVEFIDFFMIPVGWVFPACPGILVKFLNKINEGLLKIEGLKARAGSFLLIGRKPL